MGPFGGTGICSAWPCVGLKRDNGKENGNYRDYRDYIGYSILWVYRDNGKQHGNHYSELYRV